MRHRDQEGLPDYWGIETYQMPLSFVHAQRVNQEGLPDYWGIETLLRRFVCGRQPCAAYQEGLPDYWGIETHSSQRWTTNRVTPYQEGLPDYWGIETCLCQPATHHGYRESGRITRLLGY